MDELTSSLSQGAHVGSLAERTTRRRAELTQKLNRICIAGTEEETGRVGYILRYLNGFQRELKDGTTEYVPPHHPDQIKIVTVDGSTTKTALIASITLQSAEMTELCLSNGADPNQCIMNGPPVLAIATYIGNVDIVRLLLLFGADINVVSPDGGSVVHMSVSHPQVLALFLTHPDVNINRVQIARIVNISGTLLHTAIRHEKLESVNLLLQSGADITIRSPPPENELPMHLAKRMTDQYKKGHRHYDENGKTSLDILMVLVQHSQGRKISVDELNKLMDNFTL